MAQTTKASALTVNLEDLKTALGTEPADASALLVALNAADLARQDGRVLEQLEQGTKHLIFPSGGATTPVISVAGTGYVVGDTMAVVSDGTGEGGSIVVTAVNVGGAIAGVSLISGGVNYSGTITAATATAGNGDATITLSETYNAGRVLNDALATF